jgi:hypothetical protein
MTVHKLGVIGWLFIAILVSGLCRIAAGKSLQAPLGLVHKALALVCLILLIRTAGSFRTFEVPALRAAIVVFAVAYLAAFTTGIVQSIPASASSVWLNLHRITGGVAAIACAVAARVIATARP